MNTLTKIDYREWHEIGSIGLTNFDHSIKDGTEAALKSGRFWTRYAGWNFNGRVWWDGQQFLCDVWVDGHSRGLVVAATLAELMTLVSDAFGYD